MATVPLRSPLRIFPSSYTVPSSFEFPSNSWLAGCQDCFELRNLEVYTVRNWNASRQCTWGRRPRCHSARHPAAHASTCTASVDQADCEMTQAVARCTPKNAFITEVYQEPGNTALSLYLSLCLPAANLFSQR